MDLQQMNNIIGKINEKTKQLDQLTQQCTESMRRTEQRVGEQNQIITYMSNVQSLSSEQIQQLKIDREQQEEIRKQSVTILGKIMQDIGTRQTMLETTQQQQNELIFKLIATQENNQIIMKYLNIGIQTMYFMCYRMSIQYSCNIQRVYNQITRMINERQITTMERLINVMANMLGGRGIPQQLVGEAKLAITNGIKEDFPQYTIEDIPETTPPQQQPTITIPPQTPPQLISSQTSQALTITENNIW